MNIPDKIRLFGKTYKIDLVADEKNGGNNGFVTYYKQNICIWDGLETDSKREVLLHELIHAINKELKINLKENQVHNLGVGLDHLLVDNPQLIEMYLPIIHEKEIN